MMLIVSCGNVSKMNYYFPENSDGFYAIIYNAKDGIKTEKRKGEYEYNFEKSNIILAKETKSYGRVEPHYYLLNKEKTIKKEIVKGTNFIPKNNQTIVYAHILASYTKIGTKKEVIYGAIWLLPHKDLSDEEQREEDKRQRIQMSNLHREIDSLVNIGIL